MEMVGERRLAYRRWLTVLTGVPTSGRQCRNAWTFTAPACLPSLPLPHAYTHIPWRFWPSQRGDCRLQHASHHPHARARTAPPPHHHYAHTPCTTRTFACHFSPTCYATLHTTAPAPLPTLRLHTAYYRACHSWITANH